MKRKLEAELISIAHRILKIKNKSDVAQLHEETRKLYEKLSVLRFAEENFAGVRPTIGQAEVMEKLETGFDYLDAGQQPEEQQITTPAVSEAEHFVDIPKAETAESPEPSAAQSIAEPQPEPAPIQPLETPMEKEVDQVVAEAEEEVHQSNQEPAEESAPEPEAPKKGSLEEALFAPAFEWAFERKEEEEKKDTPSEEELPSEPKVEEPSKEVPVTEEPKIDKAAGQIAFDDLLGQGYKDPVFVKPEELAREKAKSEDAIPISRAADKIPVYHMNSSEIADRTVSLNERLSKGITVGLNDRIAFVKHLFNNSNEDYNRVLSQLITFNTFEEATEFIEQMVKPDYNNWNGKDEYAQRFMEIVEKKFT